VTIDYAGSLPVSAVNVGLTASLPGLAAEVTRLEADITGLAPAVTANVELGLDFPPNPISIQAALETVADLAELTVELNPTNILTVGADANLDLVAELGLVNIALSVAEDLAADLDAGLAVGSISGWSYSGGARNFGAALKVATADGYGTVAATTEVSATLIACESPSSWDAFDDGIYVGSERADLHYLGELGAWQWSTGLVDVMVPILLFVDELQALKVALEAQIQLTLGLNLPEPQIIMDAVLDVLGSVSLETMLDDMVNVVVDFDLTIEGIQARIDWLLELTSSIETQLSAGGLSVWQYSGPAANLGSEFAVAIAEGVPSGNGPSAAIDGLVLAFSPAAAGNFGNVFLAA
jgi:hypothetical protein